MIALILLALNLVASLFKSKSRLEAENAARRLQLIVLRRKARGRVRLSRGDRLFFVQLYRMVSIDPQGNSDRGKTAALFIFSWMHGCATPAMTSTPPNACWRLIEAPNAVAMSTAKTGIRLR